MITTPISTFIKSWFEFLYVLR